MSDWPADRYCKTYVSTTSIECAGAGAGEYGGSPASAVWPSANLAIFYPFSLGCNFLAKTLWWCNAATVAGNVDIGVYTGDGTKLFSAGSTAMSGASQQQTVALGTAFLLTPNLYYFAFTCSSATATFVSASLGNAGNASLVGMAQQATALPLPATATPAAIAQTIVPLCGISMMTVV